MRTATHLALSCLALSCFLAIGCGDPGHRDRSLRARPDSGPQDRSPRLPRDPGHAPSSSVIGLTSDPLAQLYAEDASLVVRLDDMTSLRREAAPQLRAVLKALPELGWSPGAPDALLRRILKLPESVVFDPLRPFAFVKTKAGWVALLPTRPREEAGDRLRALDGIYCVAGEPEVVKGYKPGYRKGFFLAGDCSIITRPDALPTIGRELAALLGPLGVRTDMLDNLVGKIPADVARIDFAFRFSQAGLRCDVRIAPARDSATALFLERMKPVGSEAMRWLPAGGTIYLELSSPVMDWEGLLLNLLRDSLRIPTESQAPGLHAMRQALSLLDRDAAAMLDLAPDGAGRLTLVARVSKPDAMRHFLASDGFKRLLGVIAGEEGRLEWTPDAFRRAGVKVGVITGHVSRRRIREWRNQGVAKATASFLMRGPVAAYVAMVDDKLCLLIGGHARTDTERFLDALVSGGHPARNEHHAEVDPLFLERLASASVDLAALFDGSREAAPFWCENGLALRDLALRWRLPAAAAVTIEGGALRFAVRVQPRQMAEVAAKIVAQLRKGATKAKD